MQYLYLTLNQDFSDEYIIILKFKYMSITRNLRITEYVNVLDNELFECLQNHINIPFHELLSPCKSLPLTSSKITTDLSTR